ncbi:hypothetical protein OSI51_15545, partial [Mycobacterium ulcerans]
PPPRPPQSTIPQLTSLLINNAGALVTWRLLTVSDRPRSRSSSASRKYIPRRRPSSAKSFTMPVILLSMPACPFSCGNVSKIAKMKTTR